MVRDPAFQFDFAAAPPPPKPPAWLDGLIPILKLLAPVMPWLFWGAMAAGLAVLLVAVGREVLRERGGGRRRGMVLPGSDQAPASARLRALLEDADRLAAEHRFGEAARVLLHRTLEELSARRPGLIAPAQTSREIAALGALPAEVREPLAEIARAVERFVFAGRPLDVGAFQSCRSEYDRFLVAVGRA